MTIYDYIVIGVYLLFMLSLGPIYKSFSKTASDFFRGGGGMLWWVVGSSAFMTSFSAWSFTGGAAKAYETGTYFLILFGCNIVALIVCYLFAAAKFRQMRVVTAVEGIRKRYGAVSEQVYTWLPLGVQTFMGGVMLYTISVFMSGVFGLPMDVLIVTMTVVVIGMTLMGGSWAATAGDFVQMLVVLTITISMAALTLGHEEIGGLKGLISKAPEYHFQWDDLVQPWIIVVFIVTLMINQVTMLNSMLTGAARYLFVKDGKDARRAVLVSIAGFVFLAPIWMIPALGSAVLFPDLGAMEQFSELNNANEAAYVAIAMELLPPGLLGLLVCGIFAASLTSMNSLLNVSSGTFVRNFYIRIVNKDASEAKQILTGRVFILIYGLIWMLVAMFLKDMKEIKLFDLLLKTTAMIGLPTAIPLTFGMFFKKTPDWAAWVTMVAGFIMAIIAKFGFTKDWMQSIWGKETPLGVYELADLNLALTTGSIFIVCVTCYFLSMLFYKKTTPEYREAVDDFFVEINTPIDPSEGDGLGKDNDSRQYQVLANICLAYGLLTLLLLAIPNEFKDRLLILACGGFVVIVGVVLRLVGRRKEASISKDPAEPTTA